jgi:hypothetical protein
MQAMKGKGAIQIERLDDKEINLRKIGQNKYLGGW